LFDLTIEIEEEQLSNGDAVFVAQCLEFGIASQGESVQDALKNVKEAISLWLEIASSKEIDNYKFALRRENSGKFKTQIEVPYGQSTSLIGH